MKKKPSRKIYRKAAKRIAFSQAMFTAAIVTTITAVGYFLALSEYALLLWGAEFFIVLAISYHYAVKRLYKDVPELLGKKKTYEAIAGKVRQKRKK